MQRAARTRRNAELPLSQLKRSFSARSFHCVCAGFSASPKNLLINSSVATRAAWQSGRLIFLPSVGTVIEPRTTSVCTCSPGVAFLRNRSICVLVAFLTELGVATEAEDPDDPDSVEEWVESAVTAFADLKEFAARAKLFGNPETSDVR
jgi:hypothetical protein